jgi:hypothetical protein
MRKEKLQFHLSFRKKEVQLPMARMRDSLLLLYKTIQDYIKRAYHASIHTKETLSFGSSFPYEKNYIFII